MTGYISKLDEEVFSEERAFETTKIKVRIMSYKGGEKKIHISRENQVVGDAFAFTKLGRFNRTEAEFVVLAIAKALEEM